MFLALLACVVEGDSPGGDDSTVETDSALNADSGDSSAPLDSVSIPDAECPESSGYEGADPHAARTLTGEATWVIDFDAAAEAEGYADCSYRRTYGQMVEREGHGWQCPTCDWFTAGEAEVVSGYEDCATLISSADAVRMEHLGVGELDGELHFWRTGAENLALGDMGVLTGTGTEADPIVVAWTDEGEISGAGTFLLTAGGEFVMGEDSSVLIEDTNVPRETPYSCGWSECNPGGPVESYTLTTGGVFPNARLLDSCGEQVDIWDFWGRYLVIDSSAPDCGPCITLARAESAWVAEMAAAGIEVEWVTLLNESLSSVNRAASPEALQEWISGTGTGGAVLSDEGFAYTIMPAYIGSDSGMSYPTMVVVSPDMTVLGWDAGFSDEANGGTGFSAVETLIFDDIALRYPQ